tara:strand:- start:444 stop:674 length:231 start_codon:yes stop_codon:yes gene_type:complete
MKDDDLAVKEETTEAGQISELNKEIQKLQDQIRELSLRPKGMKTWERALIYILLICNLPLSFFGAVFFYTMLFGPL